MLDTRTTLAYKALRDKQLTHNSLLWQTPALGIAAQSFLLAIGFNSSLGFIERIISSLLAIVIGFAAFQLLVKHRYVEYESTRKLNEIENKYGLINVHGRLREATYKRDGFWFFIINRSSYHIWKIVLLLTTLGAIVSFCIIAGLIRYP